MNDRRNNLESQIARSLAETVHGKQTDKNGNPYMLHVLKVASDVAHLGQDYYVVGLLHDAIEDTEDEKGLRDDINFFFKQNIVDALDALTKRKGENYLYEYLPRVMENEMAVIVKIADVSHNLSRNKYITDKKLQKRLRTKYERALDMLGLSEQEINELI
jgi:(p)ppGpp synthase/HD superfamily hydrolase|tara:strand:- start:774 stop:1253 length:480 start_codon:yes stop_codon:yes gene_type:complete